MYDGIKGGQEIENYIIELGNEGDWLRCSLMNCCPMWKKKPCLLYEIIQDFQISHPRRFSHNYEIL